MKFFGCCVHTLFFSHKPGFYGVILHNMAVSGNAYVVFLVELSTLKELLLYERQYSKKIMLDIRKKDLSLSTTICWSW